MKLNRPEAVLTVLLAAVCAFVLGLVIAGSIVPSGVGSSPTVFPDPGPRPPAPALSAAPDFADIIERVNPAVVNITAVGREKVSQQARRFFGNPLDLFGRGDPHEGLELPQRGSGTGFLVDRSGYLLTNDHVIENAERVEVTLVDSRTLRAQVVGRDRVTDLALLKLEPPGDYPAIPLGDSDKLRVGEWVCAIGNPLRLYDHTATVGVVSYKGRTLFNPSFDNYIQTDAAINVGNSGGPLLNRLGEVVGINTAVSERGHGIGFAVPINSAKEILPQLKADGRVRRGYLGVQLDDVDGTYQKALGLAEPQGAVIVRVSTGSAAEKAGLKRYDVIVAVEERLVASGSELVKLVSATPPGTKVRFTVLREGKPQSFVATLAEREVGAVGQNDLPNPERPPRSPEESVGLTLQEAPPEALSRVGQTASGRALVVKEVDPFSPAADQGIRAGDLLLEVNRQPVGSPGEYRQALSAARPGDTILLYVVRGPESAFVAKIRLEP
jgi:serine protease Do